MLAVFGTKLSVDGDYNARLARRGHLAVISHMRRVTLHAMQVYTLDA